jgi:hypothetical protein
MMETKFGLTWHTFNVPVVRFRDVQLYPSDDGKTNVVFPSMNFHNVTGGKVNPFKHEVRNTSKLATMLFLLGWTNMYTLIIYIGRLFGISWDSYQAGLRDILFAVGFLARYNTAFGIESISPLRGEDICDVICLLINQNLVQWEDIHDLDVLSILQGCYKHMLNTRGCPICMCKKCFPLLGSRN